MMDKVLQSDTNIKYAEYFASVPFQPKKLNFPKQNINLPKGILLFVALSKSKSIVVKAEDLSERESFNFSSCLTHRPPSEEVFN